MKNVNQYIIVDMYCDNKTLCFYEEKKKQQFYDGDNKI